ncbi:MAG TPA: response regulator [Nitrospiraceae bacterium]|nr:response regulator [Nitrospiraceae bacterium]
MNRIDYQNDTPAVLVVDDDPDILAALHDLLDHEGYQVTCASTCGDALAEATASPYDAVLLDIGLPDGDGLSVLDLLREQHPSLPVIILTAFGSPEYRARSLSHGAFSCVNKPYDQDALRGLLRRAIRAHASIDTIPSSTPASSSPDS